MGDDCIIAPTTQEAGASQSQRGETSPGGTEPLPPSLLLLDDALYPLVSCPRNSMTKVGMDLPEHETFWECLQSSEIILPRGARFGEILSNLLQGSLISLCNTAEHISKRVVFETALHLSSRVTPNAFRKRSAVKAGNHPRWTRRTEAATQAHLYLGLRHLQKLHN
jgi:hypothetical protein